jgi:hypothetical protein
MIPKSGYRFPAFAKPASAGEGRSGKIMLNQKNYPGGIGSAVVDLIFSMAKREVTFFSGTAAIKRL